MTEPLDETDVEDDLFYFESDHLALKGNKEYNELVKTLVILQAQQQRAIKDYEKVEKIKQECLRDPLGTVEKVKRGDDLGIPDLQVIADIPDIPWSSYDVAVPEEGLKMLDSKVAKSTESNKAENKQHKADNPDTYNRPWSTEEQKRLEELLLIYPPEPIELRRFKKIAAALGNRTAKQVTSRVQKYFLKLYKEGLPIPGRIPKSKAKHKKSGHKHQRFNQFWRPSTFFPDLDIPVNMNEAEEVPGPKSKQSPEAPSTSHSNYLIPGNYSENNDVRSRNDLEYQVDLLRKVKYEKGKLSRKGDKSLAYHYGYKCDFCNEEPITGTRWHCTTCTNTSVDFCTDCLITQMYSENSHPLAHRYVVIRGNDDVAVSSSDSESAPLSERNEAESSSDEISNSEMQREYTLSDFGLDDDSCSLPDLSTNEDVQCGYEVTSETEFKQENGEIRETVVEISEDAPYDYLCSLINNDFDDTNIM